MKSHRFPPAGGHPEARSRKRRKFASALGVGAVRFRSPPIPKPPTPPFSPAALGGLAMWLKADAGTWADTAMTIPAGSSGSLVAAWSDQSGKGAHATQSAAGNRPVLQLHQRAGLPAVVFTEAGPTVLIGNANAQAALQGVMGATVLVVASTGVGGNRRPVHFSVGTGTSGRVSLALDRLSAANNSWAAAVRRLDADPATNLDSPANALTAGQWSAYGAVVDFLAGTLALWQDGTVIASAALAGSGPVSSTPSQAVGIGGISVSLNQINGSIGEVVVCSSTLSPSDLASLASYFQSRWATP